MPKLGGRSTKRLVLDIGSSAIRLCELTQTKSGYQLSKYYQREMLIDPALDEAGKRDVRRQALRDLLKDAKVRAKKVIFGVPGQSVFTRIRALPPVPEHKVTQIVRYEIQQQIPFSLDQIALDYQVLGRTEAGGYDVLMAAIKVDVVDKHLDLIQELKRSVDLVDVAPLAAYNWLKHTGEFGDQGECVALLDIGASTTDIVIERENQVRFTRSLNIGGNDITSAISRNFNVGFAEAERLKRERGFAPTGDAQRDGKGGEVIGQVLGRLTGEIARSFGYFRSQPGGGPVSRVILAGGTASLRNIVPYLQRQLGLDVRIAQPLAGLAVSANAQEANERPEQAAVVLGLALRNRQSVPVEINLIPPRILESAKRKEQAFYWALSVVTLALIMASVIPLRAKRNEVVLKHIDLLKSQLEKFDPALARNPSAQSQQEIDATAAENQVSTLQGQIKQLDALRGKRTFWLNYLKALNDARPPGQGVWFSSIQTTVIGGPQNTGDAVAPEGAPDAAAGAAAPAPAAPAPAAGADEEEGGSARGGLFARLAGAGADEKADGEGEDEEGGGLLGRGMLGGLSGMMGGGAGGPVALAGAPTPTSTGFPGLAPVVAPGTGGAAGGGGGGMLGGGMMGAAGGTDQPEAKSEKPIEPNGLVVLGYAESPEAITSFIDRLKEGGVFKSGIYLDETATKNVPMTELYNANVDSGGSVMNRMPSTTGPGAGDEERGGLMGLQRGGGSFNANTYNPAAGAAQGPMVTAFRIDVQFAGKPVELKEGQSLSQQGGGGGMPGGGAMGGGLFRRGDDE